MASTPYPLCAGPDYDALVDFILDARRCAADIAAQALRGGAARRGASGRATLLVSRVAPVYASVCGSTQACVPLAHMLGAIAEAAEYRRWS